MFKSWGKRLILNNWYKHWTEQEDFEIGQFSYNNAKAIPSKSIVRNRNVYIKLWLANCELIS